MEEARKYGSNDSLIKVSNMLFKTLVDQLNVNTAYIAKREYDQMDVINSFNRNKVLVTNDMVVDYKESNCKYVIENDKKIQFFTNLMTHRETKNRSITKQLQAKAFLGVALNSSTGVEFGTLCVADQEEKEFSEEDIKYIRTIGDVLSFIIELDDTYEDVGMLSVPIIPISSSIAILALQGNISSTRGLKISECVLDYVTEKQIDYLIIDLSEMKRNYKEFLDSINRLISSLKLMGIDVMLSGVSPELASVFIYSTSSIEAEYVQCIEKGLDKLGFELREKR
ncbi:anti-anti-sigma factor [Aciduricibacillus chroicocephali]|uniref:Anti-anti-sigma factor n=1 Tax=Aciduricibacillus chroicocephali TaxID=3054939 RepID=A0ABY9KX58_9BACI|nr:anti-anti-sigma factor [Bacillaceae bacterium 44XB]